jgi:hypothetical protein
MTWGVAATCRYVAVTANLDELGGENGGVRIPDQLGSRAKLDRAVVVEVFERKRCCPL